MSDNVKQLAIKENLWNGNDEFNFAKIFANANGQSKGCQRYINGNKLLQDLSQGIFIVPNSLIRFLFAHH